MRKKKLMRRLSVAEASLGVALFLWLWTAAAEKEARVTPEYPKKDISGYAGSSVHTGDFIYVGSGETGNEGTLTKEDYTLLFEQTGLAGPAVDALYSTGRQEELLELQEHFFEPVKVGCKPNTVISRAEYLLEPEDGQRIPAVEEGDILINFNCHFFGWRSGHAAIVTDAQKRLTLEARVLGTDTAILNLDRWQEYPSFAVLRLKNVSREERKEIAKYAVENLADIPYRLTAGLWERNTYSDAYDTAASVADTDAAAPLSGTQCAHLVWYAYSRFGYDLDSDGGSIVTPRDLYESPYLEIIQIYGMEPP